MARVGRLMSVVRHDGLDPRSPCFAADVPPAPTMEWRRRVHQVPARPSQDVVPVTEARVEPTVVLQGRLRRRKPVRVEGVPVGLTTGLGVAPVVAEEADAKRGAGDTLRPLDDEVDQRANPQLEPAPEPVNTKEDLLRSGGDTGEMTRPGRLRVEMTTVVAPVVTHRTGRKGER